MTWPWLCFDPLCCLSLIGSFGGCWIGRRRRPAEVAGSVWGYFEVSNSTIVYLVDKGGVGNCLG